MKKLTLVLGFFAFGFANAQAPLEEGRLQLNAGVGVSGWGTPVYVGLDYGLVRNVTLGGELSYQTYNTVGFKNKVLGIQANGNYHFNELLKVPSNWDFYGGASLSFYNWSSTYNGNKADYNDADDIGVGLQIGGRYFFNDNFGVNLQIGDSSTFGGGKIGITYKL